MLLTGIKLHFYQARTNLMERNLEEEKIVRKSYRNDAGAALGGVNY